MKPILRVACLTAVFSCAMPALAADVSASVKAIYDKQCAKCHGADGRGQTRMGRQSGARDYTDPKVQADITDERAMKAMKEGFKSKGKEVMKPAENVTEEDMRGLLKIVRSFEKK